MKTKWSAFVAFAFVITILRVLFASSVELAPDEAYYWRWSLDLSLVYPDHPPLIAWLIAAGTRICGDTPLGVRFFGVVFSTISIWVVYQIGRLLGLPKETAAWIGAISTLMPASTAAAIVMTPDTPLGFFWLIAIYALTRIALSEKNKKPTIDRDWYILGACIGFGILAKYSALMLIVVVSISIVLIPTIRASLRGFAPYLASVLAVLIVFPHLWASLELGNQAVTLQVAHLLGQLPGGEQSKGGALIGERLGGLLGGQLGLLTPPIFYWLILGAVRGYWQGIGQVFAVSLGLPIVATTIAAFWVHPEQNWASVGHPIAPVLVFSALERCSRVNARRFRGWVVATTAVCGLFFGLLHMHTLRPFLPLPAERDPVSRLHGWDGLDALRVHTGSIDTIVCDNYGLAAQVAWQLRENHQQVTVIGADREPLPARENILLLDQEGDWGRASLLNIVCKEKKTLPPIIRTQPNREMIDAIAVYQGRFCR